MNDASIVWEGPTVVIGELEILSAPSAEDEAAINQMAFNPGNGFEPLGITHARKAVYTASAAGRRDRGLLSSTEARAGSSGPNTSTWTGRSSCDLSDEASALAE